MASTFDNIKLSKFSDIKLDMMREASEHAIKSAESFLVPHGKQLGDVIYLRQGEISIKGEYDPLGESNYSYSDGTCSINKRLRLVVSAGFSKK